MSPRALVANGGDVAQVRRAERKVRQADEILAASLRDMLATPAGRYVLWCLLEDTHVYVTSFDHSGSVMYFKEGERNIGLRWRARLIAADLTLYQLMTREAEQRAARLDAETAAAQDAPPATGEESDGSHG
jgi:hypothetical protein